MRAAGDGNDARRLRTLALAALIALCAFGLRGGRGLVLALDNGLARTPYMGWNSWYGQTPLYEPIVMSIADTMVSRGLADAGYQYVWMDATWWDGTRDADGNIVPPERQWPHGLRFLTDYIHSKGLLAGIYTDAGANGCSGERQGSGPAKPGGPDHYQQDADQFAAWGFDAVKIDFCGGVEAGLDPATQYAKFSDALVHNASRRPLLINICDPYLPADYNPPLEQTAFWSYTFGPEYGNSWRTDNDIGIPKPSGTVDWDDTLDNLRHDAEHPEAAGPGHWNDPDYLDPELGMSPVEDQSQFTMWAMLAAPLIIGSDVRKLSDATIAMLTNPEVIAVDQDPLGRQGIRLLNSLGLEVWSKQLALPGARAVALLNLTSFTKPISVNWKDLGLTGAASVRDLWAHEDLGAFDTGYTTSVPSHGAALLYVRGTEASPSPQSASRLPLASGAASASVAGQAAQAAAAPVASPLADLPRQLWWAREEAS